MKSFTEFNIELQKCYETINFNKVNGLDLFENPFRPESDMFSVWWDFLRKNVDANNLNEDLIHLLSSNIGQTGLFESKKVFLDIPYLQDELSDLSEGVELNVPKRGGPKKYYVYVKNSEGNIIKVSFGQPGMDVKINNPKAREAFAARQKCKDKTDKTTPGYWSCNLPKYAKYVGLEGGGNYYW